MASNYGIPDVDSVGKKEYFDESELLSKKLDLLSTWIKECQHCVIFTGAGISTSTGIPDFRSGMNTVLTTGPGVWELRDKGLERPRHARTTSSLQAIPSSAHMAIVQLQKEGLVKFVVSQNTDGLHLRSGIPVDSLAELHGNTNLEKCQRCKARYLRDYRVRNAREVHNHLTGRQCDDPACKGRLKDTIINFGENLPARELNKAFEEAQKADLCVVLGSSLRVTPASDIPQMVASRDQKLVIGNLQKTPLHSSASLSIHALCDEIMQGLMDRLGLPIPKWELQRRVGMEIRVTKATNQSDIVISARLSGLAIEKDIPYSFLKQVIFNVTCQGAGVSKSLSMEPFHVRLSVKCASPKADCLLRFATELHFQGHYGEKAYTITEELPCHSNELKKEYHIFYDPMEGRWRSS